MTDPNRAVFLSYASEDAAAVQRICEALRAAGIEVWFDRSELRGGDAWDRQIKKQIHECALFIAVISTHSNARNEGYFRREWRLAVDRTHDMADDSPFLLPVIIDDTPDLGARVPDPFRAVQWSHLPAGDTPPEFVERVLRLLSPDQPKAATPSRAATARATTTIHISKTSKPSLGASWRLVVALLLITAAVIVAGYFVIDRALLARRVMVVDNAPPVVASAPEKSIAVLPFLDMSEKHDQEYFSDGLSEELIDLLSKIPALRVPARTSSFYFKGKADDIATIAARLHVAHVLEGSVRRSGNQLRVTVQLIRADSGYHVWSETYDRKWDDVFKVQDEIAAAVVKALEVSLLGKAMPTSLKASNSAAYALYLQGRAEIRTATTRAEDEQAVGLLERAAHLDPGYAPTWALLSRMRVSNYEDFKAESLPKVRAEAYREAQQAIKLDPDWAEGHVALARIYMTLDWNWSAAGQEMHTALALDGDNPDVLRNASYLARTLGHFDESLRLMRAATDRDPLYYFNFACLGIVQIIAGQMAEAIASFQKAEQLSAADQIIQANFAVALLAHGQPADALSELERVPDPKRSGLAVELPRVLDALGRTADADQARAELQAKYGKSDPYWIGFMYAAHSDLDQAFVWWERAFEQHDTDLVYIKMVPSYLFKPQLAADPRYQALLRKLNLPDT